MMVLDKGKVANSTLIEIMAQVLQSSSDRRASGLLAPKSCGGSIDVKNVTFAYPSRPEHTIFHNLNLKLSPGSCTATVGGAGSGKSTIANLLLELYSTTSALEANHRKLEDRELVLGGRYITGVDTAPLRSLVLLVSQTPTLFSATVGDNISYGLPQVSRYKLKTSIIAAAKQAGVHDFITSLPHGYDTRIGDGGVG